MGAFASTEVGEFPDLVVDVVLEDGAEMPCYPSTGRGGMALVSNRDMCIRANEEVAVSTGVAFHMPYMLVGMVTDAGCLPHTDVRTDVVDFDDSASCVAVRLIYRPPPLVQETEPMLHIVRGQPLALLTILPIGRPSLRAVRLAEEPAEGDNGEENEDEDEEDGDEPARQDEARQVHKILTEHAAEAEAEAEVASAPAAAPAAAPAQP